MMESVGGQVMEDLKKSKHLAISQIGVAMLIGGAIGYGAAAVKTQVQAVVRTVQTPIPDAAEINRLRKQMASLEAEKASAVALAKARKELIVRYMDELAYVDDLNARMEGGQK